MRFDNGTLQLSVEDTGTGDERGGAGTRFTAFERLPNAMAEEGVGLGLSIVKELVGLLGGTIELTSRKGSGSCFTVLLPVSTAEDTAKKENDTRPLVQPFYRCGIGQRYRPAGRRQGDVRAPWGDVHDMRVRT